MSKNDIQILSIGYQNIWETTFKILPFLSFSRSLPSPLALKGDRKYQVHLIIEARHGVVIEDNLVVRPGIHLGGETELPVEIGVSEVSDFIIDTVYVDFLNLDQSRKHMIISFNVGMGRIQELNYEPLTPNSLLETTQQ